MAAAVAGVELCREIASAAPLRPYVKREVVAGPDSGRLDHARVITGNTMAPCVIIGECAALLLKGAHRL